MHPGKVVHPGCIDAATGYDYTYPDLSPDVTQTYMGAEWITYNGTAFTYGPPVFYFDTHARNLGTVALDLQSEDVTNLQNPPASQCVAWTLNVCRERVLVGGFEVHPTHNHIHFSDFARYELRHLQADGTPDYSAAGLIGLSDKVSFCLIDSRSLRLPHSSPAPAYPVCNGVREGISAGWADIYSSDLEGQSMKVGTLSDGRYALVISMNTAGNVHESAYDNNKVTVIVEFANLSEGRLRTAKIISRSWE